jgi:anti-sigma B factor antagonist
MTAASAFQCEVEKLPNDSQGNKVTTVKCHGRLVTDTAAQIKEAVKALIPEGGRIVVDLSDLSYLDSTGLGTLVGLKASAINQGLCILEFVNMTPRVLDLLRITNLTKMFSS